LIVLIFIASALPAYQMLLFWRPAYTADDCLKEMKALSSSFYRGVNDPRAETDFACRVCTSGAVERVMARPIVGQGGNTVFAATCNR
jgi:hypothetical protein